MPWTKGEILEDDLGQRERSGTRTRPAVRRLRRLLAPPHASISGNSREPEETRGARSQTKAPLDLIVWDAVASIELREAFLDFRKEHQTLNSIVDGSIWRQFANRLNHLFSSDAMWHKTLILPPLLPAPAPA